MARKMNEGSTQTLLQTTTTTTEKLACHDEDEHKTQKAHHLMMKPVQEDAVASEDEASAVDTDDEDQVQQERIQGVIFGRSVRSSYACLHVARHLGSDCCSCDAPELPVNNNATDDDYDDDNWEPILIRLQFQNNPVALRSYCRRFCKLGDLLVLRGAWTSIDAAVETTWQSPRLVVNLKSLQETEQTLAVMTLRYWGIQKCQAWQREYLSAVNPMLQGRCKGVDCPDVGGTNNDDDDMLANKRTSSSSTTSTTITNNASSIKSPPGHGGGLGKRIQGEYVTKFLLHVIMRKLLLLADGSSSNSLTGTLADPSTWATTDPAKQDAKLYQRAVEMLNAGTGVVDAAGGSGHVSMALGLAGVHSTVVDPREHVGKLPGRDRKIWNKAIRRLPPPLTDGATGAVTVVEAGSSMQVPYCQPVQYGTMRAWFGQPPVGVDDTFRHPDKAELPVCTGDHSLLATSSAVVALHPDEATDAIVDTAVEKRIPFVIVPCCVFYRLFPHRRKPGSRDPVSTHADLLDYLAAKDVTIQRTKLPFDGANTVLWSTF